MWVTAVAVAVAVAAALFVAPSASASTSGSFVSLVNSARASAGLKGYAVSSQLTSVALGQAERMAAHQRLYHNPSLATQVTDWKYVGENVGYGPDVTTLFNAFMHSAPHRANILDHDFTQVGIGAVTKNGTIWVSMVFREPLHAPTTSSSKSTSKKPGRTTSSHARSGTGSAGAGKPAGGKAPATVRAAAAQPAGPTAADVAEPGFACSATAAVADRVRDVTDLDRTARLLESAQLMVRGFQCGRGLPMTGVLDDATLQALGQS